MVDLNAKELFEKGIKYFSENKLLLAEKNFENALKLAPDRISILENLATVYYLNEKFEDSENILNKSIKLQNNSLKISNLMIKVLQKQGKIKELKSYIAKELSKKKLDLKYNIIKNFSYPIFFENEEEIKLARSEFENSLDELEKIKDLKLKIDSDLIEPPIFYISYDRYENLNINKKIVNLYRKFYPELNQNFVVKKKRDKIKIGFLSEFFTNHTIGKLYKGIIFNLNPEKFDVVIFHSQNTTKSKRHSEFWESEILLNIHNVILPHNFNEKIKVIKQQNLDIAFFPDVGMSTEFYFLSYIRFARVQMTSWGHPVTTGNNSIDYFLSSKLFETKDDKNKFSEKLILSNYLPMFYYKSIIDKSLRNDEITNKNIYFCSQNLIKIRPHFDLIIKKILEKDKKANILFIKSKNKIFTNKLYERFKKNIPFNTERISFLDQLTEEDYINYCGRASVLLDPLYFGSGNSFYESMFYGTPTVTMPTNSLKSSVVSGAYKQMKIENPPVVKNIDEYTDKAVELANMDKKTMLNNKNYYSESANNYLYENKEFIYEFEIILTDLHSKNQ
jgi:protein O-GlcNAc transferase